MKKNNILTYFLLLVSSFIIFFPLIYALLASFMPTIDIVTGKIIPSSIDLKNYRELIKIFPMGKFFTNSLITSIAGMVSQVIICSMTAYALVFVDFKNKKLVFLVVMLSMFIPWEAIFVPNYITILKAGLINTRIAIILPFLANGLGTFLMIQQFKTLNRSLIETAQIDGCSHFFIYSKIVMPLSKGVLSTWGIYSFLAMWNMYLWPLMVSTRPESRTIQIGLKMLKSEEETNFGRLMAGVILVIIPSLIILFLGQKQLQKGLTSGATKE